ncbi:hypothetical protein EES46_29490 [Streptomyces sp. ADI98-10]|nr:hypothetical protein EES46_29490 [Streptomyces sp. ADI98-10]
MVRKSVVQFDGQEGAGRTVLPAAPGGHLLESFLAKRFTFPYERDLRGRSRACPHGLWQRAARQARRVTSGRRRQPYRFPFWESCDRGAEDLLIGNQ